MKNKKCDNCKFCKREKEDSFLSAGDLPYYSYFCNKLNGYIEYYVFGHETVNAPDHCPELMELKKSKYKTWTSIGGMTTWEEIKEGEIYHLPPLNNKPRLDVQITFKSNYSCTGKIISKIPKNHSQFVTWYERDWQYKFLTKHKIIKFDKIKT